MADRNDVWLKFMEQQWLQARQSENTRAQATTFVLALVAALQGIIVQRQFDKPSLMLALLMFGLGIYGAVLSAKLYERFRNATRRVGAIMRQLDAEDPELKLKETEKTADAKHESKFPRLYKMRLHKLWLTVFGFVCILAAFNAVLIAMASGSALETTKEALTKPPAARIQTKDQAQFRDTRSGLGSMLSSPSSQTKMVDATPSSKP